jgi:hypothetical protein
VLLPITADAVHHLVPIDRRLLGAEALDRRQQVRLVAFDADQQSVAGARRGGEGLF